MREEGLEGQVGRGVGVEVQGRENWAAGPGGERRGWRKTPQAKGTGFGGSA